MERIGPAGGIARLENELTIEPAGSAAPAGRASFGGELLRALEEVQTTADTRARELARGDGNLHETILALEKADVSMRLALKVRNKLVEAYQEVMRMPV